MFVLITDQVHFSMFSVESIAEFPFPKQLEPVVITSRRAQHPLATEQVGTV